MTILEVFFGDDFHLEAAQGAIIDVGCRVEPGVAQGLQRAHPILGVDDHQPRQEVRHLGESRAILVVLQLKPKAEIFGDFDGRVSLKWLLARAQIVHDAPQGPSVDLEISVLLGACLGCRPLF